MDNQTAEASQLQQRVDIARSPPHPAPTVGDRPTLDAYHPKIVATNRSFGGLLSAKIAARQMAFAG
jgi:hypothetical protein